MAEGQHGGYRRPSQPAAASGPGALSRRTDGGATQAPRVAAGGEYGERKQMMDLQSGAPMQGGGFRPPVPPGPTRDQLTPLGAASSRPEEDIRTGLNSIPGVNASQMDDSTRERVTSALPMLAWLASQPKASEQTRQFFRQIRGDI